MRRAGWVLLAGLLGLAGCSDAAEGGPGDVAAGVDTAAWPTTGPDGGADTATPPADTSAPPADTSAPPADTSTPPADTATPPADTAMPPADTATPSADTSPPPADTSPPPADTAGPDPGDAPDATAPDDTAPPEDAAADVPPPPVCAATVSLALPLADDFFPVGAGIPAAATVADPGGAPLTGYTVRWYAPSGALVGEGPVAADGSSAATLVGLDPGSQAVLARAEDANGPCASAATVPVNVCSAQVLEDFDQPLAAPWVTFMDASWDPGGWIEMTGNLVDRRGAVYNAADYIEPGSASIRFGFNTGGGSGSGADGFAMTVVRTDTIADVVAILNVAHGGGGLGYGAGGAYGTFAGDAFTVEIDTWYNQYNGNTELHTDPTPDDHLELTAGLDPANSLAFASVGEVEDLAWHTVRIDIAGIALRVWLDGALTIDELVPELQFRGGTIFFSGSTGYYTNYHRFDALEVLHGCGP